MSEQGYGTCLALLLFGTVAWVGLMVLAWLIDHVGGALWAVGPIGWLTGP